MEKKKVIYMKADLPNLLQMTANVVRHFAIKTRGNNG